MKLFLLIVLVVALPSCISSFEIGCRDASNNIVDWYYLYKLPRNSHKTDGLDYIYKTSIDETPEWSVSSIKIDDSTSLPGLTISQIYGNDQLAAVMYNDEPPTDRTDGTKGHTKGVMASSAKSGFWIIHSIPHFPEPNSYNYPYTGHTYGQSFLCITMNYTQLDMAAEQLLYNEPHIYYSNAPATLKKTLPNLFKAIENDTIQDAPYYNEVDFVSMMGTTFKSFAKSRYFGKDLYEDWLAPALKSDLYVETWQHGAGNLPSNCTLPFKVYNVKAVSIPESKYHFSTLKDHSKWAVGDSKSNWICVGDINRQEHQKRRGGGTVCLLENRIWQAYQKLIDGVKPCPKPEYPSRAMVVNILS